MKAGSFPGVVSRTSAGPERFCGFHRHSKPSCVSRPRNSPCQATNRSSAALLAGALVVPGWTRRKRSAPSPSRYQAFSRASAQTAPATARAEPCSSTKRAAIWVRMSAVTALACSLLNAKGFQEPLTAGDDDIDAGNPPDRVANHRDGG